MQPSAPSAPKSSGRRLSPLIMLAALSSASAGCATPGASLANLAAATEAPQAELTPDLTEWCRKDEDVLAEMTGAAFVDQNGLRGRLPIDVSEVETIAVEALGAEVCERDRADRNVAVTARFNQELRTLWDELQPRRDWWPFD